MIDAATRSVSQDETNETEIRNDDPLFELSRIMGMDEDKSDANSSQIDPQIDLEDALLAELSVDRYAEQPEEQVELSAEADVPEVALEYAAPTAMSLEDELAAMLGGNVSVVTEAPEYAAQVSEELAANIEEPVRSTPETVQFAPVENYSENMDEELEAVQLQEAIQPEETFSEQTLEPQTSFARQAPEQFQGTAPVDHIKEAELDANALEDEFSAFFDGELDDADFAFDAENDAPVEAEPVSQEPVLQEEQPLPLSPSVDREIAQFDHDIEDIFAQQFDEPAARQASAPEMPVLDTADMSAFNESSTFAIDVPNLPDENGAFSQSADDELNIDFDEASLEDDSWAGTTTAVAAGAVSTSAAALSRRVGETAMVNDDESFDETRFEAELARDIEFVSHDINTSSNPATPSGEYADGYDDAALGARYEEPKTVKRGLVVAAILGCVAIVGAIGIFAFAGNGTSGSDGPVLIEASSEPVKVAPENPGGKEVPNQDRAIFSDPKGAPAQEELVSTSEEPVDIASVPENALPSSLNGEDFQKGEDRLAPSEESASSGDAAPFVVAPRKVRTLVVRSDGTLVERAAVPTPEPIQPEATVEVENVAAVEPEQLGGVPLAAATQAEPVSDAATEEPTLVEAAPETPETAVEPTATAALPTRTVQTRTISPEQITERPSDQPVNIVNEQPAQVATAPAAETAAQAPSTPFAVQMASLPTEADAQQSARNLSGKFGNVLGGRSLVIRRAEIEGKGTYYRVRVGAETRAEANTLCEQIKSSGGSCFVTR